MPIIITGFTFQMPPIVSLAFQMSYHEQILFPSGWKKATEPQMDKIEMIKMMVSIINF